MTWMNEPWDRFSVPSVIEWAVSMDQGLKTIPWATMENQWEQDVTYSASVVPVVKWALAHFEKGSWSEAHSTLFVSRRTETKAVFLKWCQPFLKTHLFFLLSCGSQSQLSNFPNTWLFQDQTLSLYEQYHDTHRSGEIIKWEDQFVTWLNLIIALSSETHLKIECSWSSDLPCNFMVSIFEDAETLKLVEIASSLVCVQLSRSDEDTYLGRWHWVALTVVTAESDNHWSRSLEPGDVVVLSPH